MLKVVLTANGLKSNMAKKILLLGKNGQVGWELQRALSPIGHLLALGRHDFGGDLNDFKALKQRISDYKPDVIVNASAYTAVDKAESDEKLAFQVNAESVALLATLANQHNSLLVHYSTDYVFDGSGSAPWTETDTPNPLNIYGKSKLAGEQVVQEIAHQYLIFRTSWVYGVHGNNFIKTMLRLGRDRDSLSVVADQTGAPTGAELIADITAQTVNVFKEQSGIYHLSASGEASWYDFAKLIFAEAKQYIPEQLKINHLASITTQQYPTPALRPLNSRLSTQKLVTHFDLYLPDWQLGVKRAIAELLL